MRYIFFALLFANIALLAWQQVASPRDDGASMPEAGQRRPAWPEDVSTIRLLEERQESPHRERRLGRVVRSPVSAGAGPEERRCVAAGPFEDLFGGQDVVERLANLDIDADLRALDRPTGERDYRVMIPPASSPENAFRKLRELKARKIDSYVITQGPNALAISLGVFSSREVAEAARDTRSKEGYDVEISAITRLHREYWIFSGDGGDLNIPPAVWESVADQYPDLQQRLMTCAGN